MTTMMRGVLTAGALVALAAAGADSQEEAEVRSGEEIAAEMEAAAATLHHFADRWAHAATLYEAAADLRPFEDPEAQRDLYVAAILYREMGDIGGAIDALESAGSRALASGNTELAQRRFADAALVAQSAGLSREHQRLGYRMAEVASVSGLPTEALR